MAPFSASRDGKDDDDDNDDAAAFATSAAAYNEGCFFHILFTYCCDL